MTEQNPAASASESTPPTQSSLKGQDTSRDRGAAGRGSKEGAEVEVEDATNATDKPTTITTMKDFFKEIKK